MTSKPEFWSAPEMWADATVYIIGGGPSLLGMDLTPIHNRPVLGVNNAFELGLWIDVTFFGDQRWWDNNWRNLAKHPCLIVTMLKGEYFANLRRVKQMKKNNRKGLYWRGRSELCWNRNSGACAINLAYHFGAAKIVLLGFDMKVDKENGFHFGHNWHDGHTAHQKKVNDTVYETIMIPSMQAIKKDLDRLNLEGEHRKVEIVNATPGSALTVFPMVSLEETLA